MRKSVSFAVLMFFVALLSSISLIILVNVIILRNVHREAALTLESTDIVQTQFRGTDGSTTEDTPIFFDVAFHEQVNMLIRFIDDRLDEDDLLYEHETELLRYVNAHEFAEGIIHMADLEAGEVYFTIVEEHYVLYINTAEYLYVLDTLNRIFVVVTLLLLVISVFVGYRVGTHLESSEAKLKRFFSNASHELKTPLTSIQGYTESIYLGITPDVKGSCETVLKQCELMEKLIEELLLLSKLDSKALKLECVPLNVYEVIDRLLSYVRPAFDEQNIALTCHFDGDEGRAFCDERYLYHVLSTIVSNALRYANGKVEISTRVTSKSVIITVSDDGDGISDEDLPHIFKRFYVGKNGVSGIGLSLAKEIMKLHKGDISAANKEGAEMTITLPRVT